MSLREAVGKTAVVEADRGELRELATLAGRGVATGVRMIRDVHVGIADRVFRLNGPAARPAHLLHNGISHAVYAGIGGGSRAAATVAGAVVATRAAADATYRPLSERPRGDVVLGALNGAWGDLLERSRNPLALAMSIRRDGRSVEPTPDAMAAAYPNATGDVAVFLHGLCETDAAWRLAAQRHYGDSTSTHGSRLQRELSLTPVYLRYNTGLHISDNGERLDDLLEQLVQLWPVPVTRLTLVGHSMGGLVIRSACCRADERGASWAPLVRRVVYLGSPHLGAPLEVGAAAAARALRRLPETRTVAEALASRSVGIKDLRHGDVLAQDWADLVDLDDVRAEPTTCAPLLATADHYYVGATITRRHDTVAARLIGDALVPFASASGERGERRLGLQVDRGRHLPGLHHFDLLNHPRVYEVLRAWLSD